MCFLVTPKLCSTFEMWISNIPFMHTMSTLLAHLPEYLHCHNSVSMGIHINQSCHFLPIPQPLQALLPSLSINIITPLQLLPIPLPFPPCVIWDSISSLDKHSYSLLLLQMLTLREVSRARLTWFSIPGALSFHHSMTLHHYFFCFLLATDSQSLWLSSFILLTFLDLCPDLLLWLALPRWLIRPKGLDPSMSSWLTFVCLYLRPHSWAGLICPLGCMSHGAS